MDDGKIKVKHSNEEKFYKAIERLAISNKGDEK